MSVFNSRISLCPVCPASTVVFRMLGCFFVFFCFFILFCGLFAFLLLLFLNAVFVRAGGVSMKEYLSFVFGECYCHNYFPV